LAPDLRATKRAARRVDRNDEVARVQTALASIEDAQRMAGRLDQSANARAGEAAKTLAEALDDALN
jgi:hypothetical protein